MFDDQWLADQLRENGIVPREQIDAALHDGTGDLSRDLLSEGAVTESALLRFLGLKFHTRYLSADKLSHAKVPQWVLDLLPVELCDELSVLPVRCDKQKTTLSVVTPDPTDRTVMERVRSTAGAQQVRGYVALPYAVEAGIRKFYRGDLHAFTRMDESLRQDYSEMLSIYEQRLIDFEGGHVGSDELSAETEAVSGEESIRLEDEPYSGSMASATAAPEQPPPQPRASATHTRTPTSSGGVPAVARSPAAPELTPLQSSFVHTVRVLMTTIERTQGREGHAAEVASLASQVATNAGVAGDDAFQIYLAGLLHELGKPSEPHLTLLSLMSHPDHAQLARRIHGEPLRQLSSAHLPATVEQILDAIYERSDGQGVPGARAGDGIPIGARILAAADAYLDARRSGSADSALDRLRDAAAGGALDPAVVQHLARAVGGPQASASAGLPVVLVIDSDSASTSQLERGLRGSGISVMVAGTTGDAALVLLGEDVRMVISEVDLKPMDGFTFMEWLQSNERTRHIPFMFVSSQADAEQVNRGFEMGAVDYIVKPYRPELVLAKVKRLVK